MQSNADVESGDGLNPENIRSNQYNPEENNEVNYKWVCELCTYQNWMAAKTCIMCLSKRHQMEQIISENQSSAEKLVARKLSTPTIAEAANSDIFKLVSSSSPPPSILSCSPPNNSCSSKINSRSSSPASHYNNIAYYLAQQHLHQTSGASAAVSSNEGIGGTEHNEQYLLKWSCAQCTYVNLPKNPKCIQCLYSRKKISPVVSRNSPVSPRQAGNISTNFGDNSMQQHHNIYGNNTSNNSNNNNQHISASHRPQSTSPPPKTVHSNLGTTFDSLRINVVEDSISNNARNRNNSSPPHTQIQSRTSGGMKGKNPQPYQFHKQDKSILLHNRVMSPPIISSAQAPTTTSPTTSSSPSPLATCTSTAKKWICQACTYENWPKSKHCVICGCRGGKLTFIPESNRESPPPEPGSSSQNENSTRNVRPIGQSNLRDHTSQISPTLSVRGVQTQRYLNQAEILTNTAPTTSNGGSNQVSLLVKYNWMHTDQGVTNLTPLI